VLVDLGLPDVGGIDVGRSILEELPNTKVVAVTAASDSRTVRAVMGAGFHGYVTKDVSLTQFVSSINAALDGETVVPNRAQPAASVPMTDAQRHALLLADQLSPREKELLVLLVDGASSAQIADRLSLSPNTVRTHIQSIMSKLQVHSRLEAATFAVKHGIVKVAGNEQRKRRADPT
jgi:two-component system, NarL family, nitrate/nitrite response regulator NarL